jgi:hypothetical protein
LEWPLTAQQASSPAVQAAQRLTPRPGIPIPRSVFPQKIEDYSYRLLGERSMLASVEAANSPRTAMRE